MIKYNIDETKTDEEVLTAAGWAAWISGEGEEKALTHTEIRVERKSGRAVAADIRTLYRSDVIRALGGSESDEMMGFQIRFRKEEDENQYTLIFTSPDGTESEKYPVDFRTVNMLSRQENRHYEGAADMLKHVSRQLIADDFQYLRQFGPRRYAGLVVRRMNSSDKIPAYEKWARQNDVKADELARQRKYHFAYEPKISIVIPAYRTRKKYLRELLQSIEKQTYRKWQLCIADGSGEDACVEEVVKKYTARDPRICYRRLEKNEGISGNTNEALRMADGEYIVLCDHDDVIPPNALFELVKALQDREVDIVYTDEDKISMDSSRRFDPNFKPDFNPDLLCSTNYICHLFLFPRSFYEKYGGFRKEFDGAQDYDLILRYTEKAGKICHIPKILYHWRSHYGSTADNPESKSYAFENGARAVREHYERLGIPARVGHGVLAGTYHTVYDWGEEPLISIIVPNKDHVGDLKKCMDSVDSKSIYRNMNGSLLRTTAPRRRHSDITTPSGTGRMLLF